MNKYIAEGIGWYGALAILAAYTLISFDMLSASALSYQLLNLTGAVGLVYISLIKKNYSVSFLNAVWVLVAVVALARILTA